MFMCDDRTDAKSKDTNRIGKAISSSEISSYYSVTSFAMRQMHIVSETAFCHCDLRRSDEAIRLATQYYVSQKKRLFSAQYWSLRTKNRTRRRSNNIASDFIFQRISISFFERINLNNHRSIIWNDGA